MAFKRTEQTQNIIKKFIIENADNPDYLYFFCGSWISFPNIKNLGWDKDCLEIIGDVSGETIGWIQLEIDRTNDLVKNLSFCLFPEHLHKNMGGTIFKAVIDYCFRRRGFRKISFAVISENKRMVKIVERIKNVIFVGEMCQHNKLMDGKYYDRRLYEILGNEYLESYEK